MYSLDIRFAIWCANRCLHLWKAPQVVKEWLKDPKPETATRAADAAWEADAAAIVTAWSAAQATAWAAWAAWAAALTAKEAAWAAESEKSAAKALGVSVTDLRLEFVRTWSMYELEHAPDDWIEVATVELFDREARNHV